MNLANFKRIVAFGCSHTYGHGLSDCNILPGNTFGPKPSKFAWPELLGKEFNLEVVNMGKPASSNIGILSRILNFKFLETDLVIVQWTYTGRDLLFLSALVEQHILPNWNGLSPQRSKDYYNTHTEYDTTVKSLFHIHHADIFFRYRNLNCLHYIVETELPSIDTAKNTKFKWFNITLESFKIRSLEIDKADDKMHSGPKTQIEISKTIISLIKEKYEKH
jgi:hypothetical protein